MGQIKNAESIALGNSHVSSYDGKLCPQCLAGSFRGPINKGPAEEYLKQQYNARNQLFWVCHRCGYIEFIKQT